MDGAVPEAQEAVPRKPAWRRVVSVLITVYLGLSVIQLVIGVAFAAQSGSMDLQASVHPGVVLSGTFHYRYHNAAKGRTIDLPVTAPAHSSGYGRVVVDTGSRFSGVLDQSDFGPFGDAGRGSVSLPPGVFLDYERNGTALLQPLRTGSRATLDVHSPVGWRGRLLVALPSVLIWAGIGVASLVFGTFLRSIVDGEPFDRYNPRRLLWLGGSLVMVLFADSWLRVWITRAMIDVLSRHGHPIPLLVDDPGINPGPVYLIVGVLCLAGAFRAGARLAADADGLV